MERPEREWRKGRHWRAKRRKCPPGEVCRASGPPATSTWAPPHHTRHKWAHCFTPGPTASDSKGPNESHECAPCHWSPCVQSAFGLLRFSFSWMDAAPSAAMGWVQLRRTERKISERESALQFSKANTLASKRNDAVFCVHAPHALSPMMIKNYFFYPFFFLI